MKHYSESFNKRSRLIIAPEHDGRRRGRLGPPDGATLRDRIVEALRVQQDSYPCFDWVFPPPVFPKTRGPGSAEELFTDPSVVPGNVQRLPAHPLRRRAWVIRVVHRITHADGLGRAADGHRRARRHVRRRTPASILFGTPAGTR
jgi:hypothetical protein